MPFGTVPVWDATRCSPTRLIRRVSNAFRHGPGLGPTTNASGVALDGSKSPMPFGTVPVWDTQPVDT